MTIINGTRLDDADEATTLCDQCGSEFPSAESSTCEICGQTLCPECICESCD